MVKVYIEGGGNDNNNLKSELRQAFRSFFESAGLEKKPRVVACGSRNEAFHDFCCAIDSIHCNDHAILLVDSEGPTNNHLPLAYLTGRDGWEFPCNTQEDLVFLMVETMETWLLADPQALQKFYGPKIELQTILKLNDLESVPKKDVYALLDRALSNTPSKEYSKGKHSFKVLAVVDGSKVCKSCSQANNLIEKLNSLKQDM